MTNNNMSSRLILLLCTLSVISRVTSQHEYDGETDQDLDQRADATSKDPTRDTRYEWIVKERYAYYAMLHLDEEYHQPRFLSMTHFRLKRILKSDRVKVASENEVYEALMGWTRADETVRSSLLPGLLELVRLRLIDNQYLSQTVKNDPLIQNCSACLSLVEEAISLNGGSQQAPSRDVPALVSVTPRHVPMKEVVLAIGNHNEYNGIHIEMYDTRHGIWRWVHAHPSQYPAPRFGPAAAVLNNVVYLCGGHNTKSCITYDHNSEESFWKNTTTADLLEDRKFFGMATLNGFIYAVGGQDNPTTAERYDPALNSWTRIADLSVALHNASTAVTGDSLYAAGSGHLLKYDHVNNVWVQLADLPTKRDCFALIGTQDYIYAAGGYDEHSNPTAVVERFSVQTGSWEAAPSLLVPRGCLAGAAFKDGPTLKLIISGGYNGTTVLESAERLSLVESGAESSKWESIYEMTTPRIGHSLVTILVPN